MLQLVCSPWASGHPLHVEGPSYLKSIIPIPTLGTIARTSSYNLLFTALNIAFRKAVNDMGCLLSSVAILKTPQPASYLWALFVRLEHWKGCWIRRRGKNESEDESEGEH